MSVVFDVGFRTKQKKLRTSEFKGAHNKKTNWNL
jgi:hypothetical protein